MITEKIDRKTTIPPVLEKQMEIGVPQIGILIAGKNKKSTICYDHDFLFFLFSFGISFDKTL
jgi:hypothetical protein